MFGKYITYEMNDGFTGNGISEGKDYMMFAAGDDDVKNLQLSITTSENRTSKDKGKAPYIAFNSGNSLTYDFSVTNLSHKGKSFIFCCMVRLK
jgi:hypothetical protein